MDIKMLTLLMVGLLCTHTAKPFASYQTTLLPSGSSLFTSSNPSNYSYPLPTTTAGKTVSLALSGYEMSSYVLVGFDATWQATGTQVYIYFSVSTNVTFTLVKYNILVADQSLQILWLVSGSYSCNLINSQTSSVWTEYFNISTPNSILNSKIFPVLIGYTAGAVSSTYLACGLYFSRTHGTNTAEMYVAKSVNTNTLGSVSYCLVIHNVAAFQLSKYSYYHSSFVIYFPNLFSSLPLHFGIPGFFSSSSASNFDQNCAISISYMSAQKQLYPWQMHFDTTDLIAANVIQNAPLGATIFQIDYYVHCYGDECGLGTYFDRISLQCNPCPSACADCLNPAHCLNCTSNNYYLRKNTCVPCSLVIDKCLTCQVDVSLNQTNCTSCALAYFFNPVGQCQYCASLFGNCSSCIDTSACLQCVNSSFAFIPAQNSCLLCWQLFAFCQQCTVSQCTSCGNYRVPINGSCMCAIGVQIAGLCTTVTGCIQPSTIISMCLGCDDQFYLDNGTCKCVRGTLANGICNNILGCMIPIQTGNDSIQCQLCNARALFDPQPNPSGFCTCQDKYELKNDTCSEICGDGFLLNNSSTDCDDGNTLNGDGCSSTCTVQVGYRCENGSSSAPSVCFYAKGISISLQSIKRSKGLNQGVFSFELSPSLPQLMVAIISNAASFSCQSTNAAYSIAQIEYSGSTLSLTVNFSEDLQGRACNLTLSFSGLSPRYQASSLQFKAYSNDDPLLVSNNLGSYSTNEFIFRILSYASLALFLISLGHKLIGAELLNCCQAICLTNYLYAAPSFVFSPVKEFGLVTGFGLLDATANQKFMAPFSERINVSVWFFKNSLFVMSTFVFTVVLWGVIKLYNLSISHDSTREIIDQAHNQQSIMNKAKRQLYKVMIFPFTAGFLTVLMLSGCISNIRSQKDDNQNVYRFLSSISLVVAYFMMGVVAWIEVADYSTFTDYRGQRDAKSWYIPCFLGRSVLVAMLFQVDIWLRIDRFVYWPVAVQLLYLCRLLFARPYSPALHNVGVLLCELTTLYSMGLPLLQQLLDIKEATKGLLMLFLQGAIVLCILSSAIRIGVYYFGCLEKQQISVADPINKKESQNVTSIEVQCQQEKNLFQTLRTKFTSYKTTKIQNQQVINLSISANSKRVRQQEEQKAYQQQQLVTLKQGLRQQLRKYKQKYSRQSQIQ